MARSEVVTAKITPELLEVIDKHAASAGMARSAYIAEILSKTELPEKSRKKLA